MTEPAPQPCDLLIEAGWVVPVVPHGVVLEDHAVAVSGGRILAVLPTAEARMRFAPAETVSRPEAALIPQLAAGANLLREMLPDDLEARALRAPLKPGAAAGGGAGYERTDRSAMDALVRQSDGSN